MRQQEALCHNARGQQRVGRNGRNSWPESTVGAHKNIPEECPQTIEAQLEGSTPARTFIIPSDD